MVGAAPYRRRGQVEPLGLTAFPESITVLLDAIAARRGLLLTGGVPDHDRAAVAFIKDYRQGRLGRFTFEMPSDAE